MIYFTFGDAYSGIYQSQVVEACEYLSAQAGSKVRLVVGIPLSLFREQRKILKANYDKVVVLPMVSSRLHLWRLYLPFMALVFLLCGGGKVIARGAIACTIALVMRRLGFVRKVIFDGRGAQAREMREYNVADNQKIKDQIFQLEQAAVCRSDFRMAVSDALLSFWESEYGYKRGAEVVIPCTLARSFLIPASDERSVLRGQYGFTGDDIVLVYSGSTAGWQSLDLLNDWLEELMERDPRVRILFLAKRESVSLLPVYAKYSSRIVCDWVKPSRVCSILSACDYGLLFREKSITNRVAAPTKFAEYLAAGLKVVISEEIGDYSELVRREPIGTVVALNQAVDFEVVSEDDKRLCMQFAADNFTKEAFGGEYRRLAEL